MIYNVQAIVIRKSDFREYDRLLTLYTKDFGKIKAHARSVKKPRAKLTSLTELFVLAEYRLFLRQHAAFGKITGGVILDPNPLIRYNVQKYYEACYICEVLDALTPDRQPNAEKFFLLKEKLELINKNNLSQTEDFTKKLLHLTGFGVKADVPIERSLQEHLAYPLKTVDKWISG
ncbi:MAG: DNA repair protein RecO [Elusimicrobia bacterium CG06_land_8_20_14_3_00_38_11]|nr:MAG: DNA repair protein RecO [Elusimicrobia bacterium CG06_land_8_20_14_3_00_38_11]